MDGLLMEVKAAAAVLGVKAGAIYRATTVFEGDSRYGLRFVVFGGRKMIPREEVERAAREGVRYPRSSRRGRARKGNP